MPLDATSNIVHFPGRSRSPAVPRPAPRALWQLPGGALCPVIGGCLSVEALRGALVDLIDGAPTLSAFDLHVSVVGLCTTRNAISERVQDTLDAAHRADVRELAATRGAEALADAWSDALAAGEWAGTLWAVLTHGDCSDALAERMLRDTHMAQHGAHAMLAEERDRARALAVENGLLHARLQELLREAAVPKARAVSRGVGRRSLGAFGLLGATR